MAGREEEAGRQAGSRGRKGRLRGTRPTHPTQFYSIDSLLWAQTPFFPSFLSNWICSPNTLDPADTRPQPVQSCSCRRLSSPPPACWCHSRSCCPPIHPPTHLHLPIFIILSALSAPPPATPERTQPHFFACSVPHRRIRHRRQHTQARQKNLILQKGRGRKPTYKKEPRESSASNDAI